jgi:signal transduction histidine kinase/ligand-binding sensor domain-containing protein/DNA-binding response OmpR family regulator
MQFKNKIVFLSLILSAQMFAQPYSIKRLNIEQGLSSDYVVSIDQDKRGFMWFATESGLNRFDGKTFKTYWKNRQSNSGISGNELNKVLVDPTEPYVWVATQRAGLNRLNYQTETFTTFVHDPSNNNSIISNDITDIVTDINSNLWISTYHSGVDYYDKELKVFKHYNQKTIKGLVSNYIWTIADDHKGRLYIGHVTSGLSVLSLRNKTVKNYVHEQNNPYSLPNNTVRCILIDKFENVWVGTDNGLALFNTETGRFTCFRNDKGNVYSIPTGRVFTIKQMSDNRIWIGMENGGISILNIKNEMFISPENITFQNIYKSDDISGLSNATVRTIFEDSFKNVWIGTWSGGINFISHESPFFHVWGYSPVYNLPNKFAIKDVWGISEDMDGDIWVGTDGGGIQFFKNNKRIKTYTKENSVLEDNAVLTSIKDSKGNLWFGTFNGGITQYSAKEKRLVKFSPVGFTSKSIRCFYEDKRYPIMYIGSDDKGMYSYNLDTKYLKYFTSKNSGIPKDELIRSICQDDKGRLWVGSFGEGLNILDSNMALVKHFGVSNGFFSNMINYIFKDSKNRMWIATSEGLVLFRANRLDFVIFTDKDGLKSNHIQAITEDKKGDIWLSTRMGISRWSASENKFYNYNQFDGIPLGSFMSGSILKSKNGVLYFGSQNGVCYFNPTYLQSFSKIPSVEITEMFVYAQGRKNLSDEENKEEIHILPSKLIRLKYTQNTITLSYNVMDYALAHKVEYTYQLDGLSKEWYNVGQINDLTFRNLPPGNYTLYVKAKLNNQNWSDKVASVRIKIDPPLWYTWWAKLIYFIVFMYFLIYLIRFYKKRIQLENMLYLEKQNNLQQQRLNDEKLQFFTNITHELRTPLTLIIGPLEDLSADPNISSSVGKKISMIHQNSTRLLNMINKILDFRKTETHNMPLRVHKGDLSKLIREIGLKYSELNQNKNISFNVHIDAEQTVLYFDEENIYTIVDNLISNAFKYTKQGEITVTLRAIEDINNVSYTEIEVKDTGCGISQESISKIFDRYYQEKKEHHVSGTGIGLAIVKNLSQLHQADILVESEKEKGSIFKLRLITNNIYPNATREEEMIEAELLPQKIDQIKEEDSGSFRKIMLLVEDNSDIVEYIKDSFLDDFIVLTAENGKIGLDTAFTNIPDIIISDIMMPELSGYELCAMLKKDIRTSHIPIILLTAKTSSHDRTEGYSVGADSYITKPFSTSLLTSRVTNLLKNREILASQMNASNKTNKQKIFSDSLSQLDKEFIEIVVKIIRENSYTEKIDIEFIAEKVFMSHSTLYRKIKAVTGLSINEFIRKIKIQYAEELLLTGRFTISEVAFHVGFSSVPYFRQCFKEEYGSLPSEYMKKL